LIAYIQGMTMLTIELPDEVSQQLAILAREQGKTPEDLASEMVAEAIVIPQKAAPSEEFARTAKEVVKDNAELYRRLA